MALYCGAHLEKALPDGSHDLCTMPPKYKWANKESELKFTCLFHTPAHFRNSQYRVYSTERSSTISTGIEHPPITPRSLELFKAYAQDASNWGGKPCVGGNVPDSKEDRGNLTQLKRAGLITTEEIKDPGNPTCIWLTFTPKGVQFARALGEKMPEYWKDGTYREYRGWDAPPEPEH